MFLKLVIRSITINRDLCGRHTSKRPYGELGHIEKANCCCFVSVRSGFGEISPGCGCEKDTVDEIVLELKQRMRARGDTAQIVRAEETLSKLGEIEAKLVSSVNAAMIADDK